MVSSALRTRTYFGTYRSIARLTSNLPPATTFEDTAHVRSMQAEPFPFLGLPRDIRLMVYERLQPSNKHVRLSNHPDNDPDCAILVVRSLDTAILASCRLINKEARGIWVKTAKQMISSCSAQILLPAQESAKNMVALFLAAVKDQFRAFHYEVGPRGSQDKFFYGIMT